MPQPAKKNPQPMREPNPHVVGVRLRNAGKLLYYHSVGMRLEAGEYVVIETVRGPELAKVIISPGQVVVNELGEDDLKPVLRLATEADIRRMDGLRTRAREVLPEARRLADETGFPAHIDNADFTLDGRRITFSFTSEERLDYRDFLRRAGERFGAKVDMRQMGARDRAKLAGGYGICGRELCCANWLTTFPSISIRMAKEQELPLNPQKISGLCGRLLCCLSYEEDGYREMRKTLPKLGQRCSTPTGEGRVIAVNILRRQVTLVVDGQRVEIGDKDLGLVVRWDPTSKAGNPPPSLTRAEGVEQGLLSAEQAALDDEEDERVALAASENFEMSPGRGRLPGGGPRKVMRPRPEPAAAPQGATAPQGRSRGNQQRPQAAASQPPRQRQADSLPDGSRPSDQPMGGDARNRAPRPQDPPAGRTFQRASPPPAGASPEIAPGTEGEALASRGRRRRGRRGRRGGGGESAAAD
jgi:cell fate regulator YaaT (PSP1 superfamily)